MRRTLLLSLCTLLACAHSPSAGTPPEDSPSVTPQPPTAAEPSPEVRAALRELEQSIWSKEYAKGLAVAQRLWDEGHGTRDVAWFAAYGAVGAGDNAAALTWLERAVERGMDSPGELLHAKAFAPLRTLPGYDALVERARKNALAAREAGNVGSGLEKTTPARAGLSEPALAELLKQAEASGSSALVLLRHGKLVGEWYFGGETQRIEAMSATKAVVALAIGLLIDDGKIPSADTPVSAFFPEWSQGLKSKVTLRHLLNHTSGLAANRSAMDIHQSPDFVRYALDSKVVDEPGSRHFYNNKATNLLAGIVERASGEKMDVYLKRRLFAPLGIRDVEWMKDRAGNPMGMAGLNLHPVDFAKVGQLMLQKGLWNGQRVLSEAWVRECTAAPSQPHTPTGGLLWWLLYERSEVVLGADMLEEARRNGMPEPTLAWLRDLVDRPMTLADFQKALTERLGGMDGVVDFMMKTQRVSPRRQVKGAPLGYAALGQSGQQLVVLPGQDLVAVRMAVEDERVPPEVMEFGDFPRLVMKLVPSSPPAAATR
ncbi:beta-lactamase family protein [Pyxidicoccus fallax]|uniref:Beta-lactamase family protein n=1 Tax=Pyxidicoccus fallax TaxID=394095 RepID=A0A848L3F5_9BACT|nr:serine hydrolase domain-containing protein [Pyxidicoccus fallax]NMO13450.1 beta-lactamase family protein [Pyxidicoccus fallax]NPC81140.1 beta-lactamase family protein [Pyxidicoccus fallax]